MADKNEDTTFILNNKSALPNKLLQPDGTITDITGNQVINPVDSYKAKPSLPNKFLNPDGTYSTLNEILAGIIDTSLFIIVDELPASGDEQKIYLVPDDDGGFVEYHWTGDKWDPIGSIDIDLSDYPTIQDMTNAIEAAALATLNSAKNYTDAKIAEIGTDYKTFYWDGTFDQAAKSLWTTIIQTTSEVPVIVYTNNSITANNYISVAFLEKDTFADSSKTSYEIRFTPYSTYSSSTVSYTSSSERRSTLILTVENGTVTTMTINLQSAEIEYLKVNYNYPTPYEPAYPGSPATKKYVDDHISAQVFYWDGLVDQAAKSLWLTIIQTTSEFPVIVYTGTTITMNFYTSMLFLEKDTFADSSKTSYKFTFTPQSTTDGSYNSYTNYSELRNVLSLTFIDGAITNMYKTSYNSTMKYLTTDYNYLTPYEPLYPGSPATKKYVDDAIATNITQVLGGGY